MTKQNKTEVVLKKEGKNEFLYFKHVPVFFASILAPKKNPLKDRKEYAMTVFVDEEAQEQLELPTDEGGISINKELKKVGKDRNKKKKIKYPLKSQLPDDAKSEGYDIVDGLYGVSLTLGEFTKAGKRAFLKVVDKEGKDWPKDVLIGNGSVLHVKCFGYRNQDGQLVVFPNLVVVVEHVPYEGGTNGEDDVLGVTVDYSADYEAQEAEGVVKKPEDGDGTDTQVFDPEDVDDGDIY